MNKKPKVLPRRLRNSQFLEKHIIAYASLYSIYSTQCKYNTIWFVYGNNTLTYFCEFLGFSLLPLLALLTLSFLFLYCSLYFIAYVLFEGKIWPWRKLWWPLWRSCRRRGRRWSWLVLVNAWHRILAFRCQWLLIQFSCCLYRLQRAGCGERHNHPWRHRGTARCDTADRTVTSELSVANGERNHRGRGTTYLRVAYTSVARLQRVQWHRRAEYGCHHRELHAWLTGIYCQRACPVFAYDFFFDISLEWQHVDY